jgi:drug/metabolite transporter (DMT)-like permease
MKSSASGGSGKGVAAILVSTLGFAFYPILGRVVFAGGANLQTVLFLRFLFGAAVFWGLSILRKGISGLSWKNFLILLLLGAVGYAGQAGLYLYAVRLIPASTAALLLYVYPVLVTVSALLSKQEKISAFKVNGLVFSIIGLVLVLGFTVAGLNLTGAALALGAAFVYAVYILVSNRVLGSVSPLLGSSIIASGACITYGSIGLIQGFTFNLTIATWLSIAGIAVFSTVIAILAFFVGLKKVGPTTASIVSTLEPVMTVGLAYIFLGEHLSFVQAIGAACVVIGAIFAAWPRKGVAQY